LRFNAELREQSLNFEGRMSSDESAMGRMTFLQPEGCGPVWRRGWVEFAGENGVSRVSGVKAAAWFGWTADCMKAGDLVGWASGANSLRGL
jgi:hypothetical protein